MRFCFNKKKIDDQRSFSSNRNTKSTTVLYLFSVPFVGSLCSLRWDFGVTALPTLPKQKIFEIKNRLGTFSLHNSFLYQIMIEKSEDKFMTTVTYSVPNISCMHCVHTIQSEVMELKGVKSVKADATGKKVEIVFDAPADEARIKALLAEINYPVAT
jgi:copper chaperone